ncbi:MAG: nickel-dependent lactate racemase [Candidatus Helarchaeota archaeon]
MPESFKILDGRVFIGATYMVEISIKYGTTEIPYEIDEKHLLEVVQTENEPDGINNTLSRIKEIERAIHEPIGSQRLTNIIKPGSKIVITQDDHTRGTPGYVILPPLLDLLHSCGVAEEDIIILFACGTHRPVKLNEQKHLVGEDVLERITCLSHDCDAADCVEMGTTSRKNIVKINALAAKADHIIGTGKCEYHYYAGFSGGRKTILPGISARATINRNHAFLIDDRANTGSLTNNPVHEDMVEAVKMTNTSFIVNLVQNTKKNLIQAFAGDVLAAHYAAAKLYDSLYRVKVKGLADIVLVAAGYPKDIDLYQGYKAIDNAQRIVKHGGVIVAVLECKEGHGHQIFYEWAKKFRSLEELEKQVTTNFEMGGHKAYYIAKVQAKAKIILVSKMNPKELKDHFMIEPAQTVDDAMDLAFTLVGRASKVTFMPHGTMTLPTLF